MYKKITFLLITLLLISLVSAISITDVATSFENIYGEDNVVLINDYQLAYFYSIVDGNETINRAMIVDIVPNGNFKIIIGSEVRT